MSLGEGNILLDGAAGKILVGANSSKRIDIVHNHGMWQMNSLYPGWAVKKSESKLIVSPRGTFSEWAMSNGSFVKKFFWVLLQKPALGCTKCFHATSDSEYRDIRRLGFHQPVAIIPNGIDIPNLPEKKQNKLRTLLFLGRIHPVKGLDLLLHAWKEVQALFPEWQLIVAGSDDGFYGKSGYLDKMRDLSVRLDLQRIYFVGELNGIDKFKDEVVFSTICSEFCVISKKFFFKLDMWKNVNSAGGEEFDMGYKILKSNKKNIKTLSARYSGYWCNISTRFKRIVDRTSKYIPLLLKKRKFDTKGSFATFEQSLSSFLTLILAILLFINFILIGNNLSLIIIFILIFQYIIELGFLKFVFKNRGIKMLIFSLFGIHVINLGIILGVVYFVFRKMFFIK